MLHRAVLGSLERFIGILIEHYAGAFPTWLAPVQATIIPVTDAQNEAAKALEAKLLDAGIRAETDERNEKMGAKIRAAQARKVPYMIVMGKREVAEGTLAVRNRKGEQSTATPDEFVALVRSEAAGAAAATPAP